MDVKINAHDETKHMLNLFSVDSYCGEDNWLILSVHLTLLILSISSQKDLSSPAADTSITFVRMCSIIGAHLRGQDLPWASTQRIPLH